MAYNVSCEKFILIVEAYHTCNSPKKKSKLYPNTNPIIPIVSPIFIISFCFTKPVEWAIALGGVDIGSVIATDAIERVAHTLTYYCKYRHKQCSCGGVGYKVR